jgi:hypothetical protein
LIWFSRIGRRPDVKHRGKDLLFVATTLEYPLFAGNASAGGRCIRNGPQAFLGHVIDDVEDAKMPAIGELVVNKIQRPACVGLGPD